MIIWIDKKVSAGFGFQRLSIQELSKNGESTNDFTLNDIIMFNEIYNFREIEPNDSKRY